MILILIVTVIIYLIIKKIKFFGIIPEFNEISLASDHKPVMSINNLPVIFKE